MSLPWCQRKSRLQELLNLNNEGNELALEPDSEEAEETEGLAIDRLLHGQTVIGPTSRTKELESLRFGDKDLHVLGTLERGQFGVIDVVRYRHTGPSQTLFIRKTTSKVFALRTRQQNSPTNERLLLLLALTQQTPWVPKLLCAFHTDTQLSLVMEYAQGGSLWEVLCSSSRYGAAEALCLAESDLKWWIPQVISALSWCHSQGFAHRDVKPHNFVLTAPEARIQLIDFGSASRLEGREDCSVPVGTCDYVSPEVLKAHEAALVRLELEEEEEEESGPHNNHSKSARKVSTPLIRTEDEVYGLETDWWSVGAMAYELVYGIAPFFAEDVRRTYVRIMDFKDSLRFDHRMDGEVSLNLRNLLKRLLNDAEFRIGRSLGIDEFKQHSWFEGVNWEALHLQRPPKGLHLPQFVYAGQGSSPGPNHSRSTAEHSQGFQFSAFFQSSSADIPSHVDVEEPEVDPSTPGLSILHSRSSSLSSSGSNPWLGWTWGPKSDAFDGESEVQVANQVEEAGTTPRPRRFLETPSLTTPRPQSGQTLSVPASTSWSTFSTPIQGQAFTRPGVTPYRTVITPFRTPYQTQTVPAGLYTPHVRTSMHYTPNPRAAGMFYTPDPRAASLYYTPKQGMGSTPLPTSMRRRPLSDRQAMAALIDCVGMSARKRVMESGRRCRILGATMFGTGKSSMKEDTRKDGTSGFDLRRFASGVDFEPSGESRPKAPGTATTGTGTGKSRKELRFAIEADRSWSRSRSRSHSVDRDVVGRDRSRSDYFDYPSLALSERVQERMSRRKNGLRLDLASIAPGRKSLAVGNGESDDENTEFFQSDRSSYRSRSQSLSQQREPLEQDTDSDLESITTTTTGSSVPPSPSPSPRPGSVASGMLSRLSAGRSQTPTLTMTFFGAGSGRFKGNVTSALREDSTSRSRAFSLPPPPSPTEGLLSSTTTNGSKASHNSYLSPSHFTSSTSSSNSNSITKHTHDSSISTIASVLDAPLDEMGAKHEKMMRDIEMLEERLRRYRTEGVRALSGTC